MKFDVQLSGFKELEKKLLEMEKKASKKLLTQAIRAGLKPMKDAVKAAVPVGTGQTKRAVKIKAMKRSRTSFGLNVQIGAGDYKGKTFYAAFVEYGTSKMAPQGNMRRAFDETKDQSADIAIAEIKRGLGI